MSEPLSFHSEDGTALEGAVDEPDGDAIGAVILCHPHPRMGGTMNAPLLLAIRDDLLRRGWVALRFNFRGIGASEGVSSEGISEVSDVRGVIAWVGERYDLPYALVGWSFGAAVAIRAAASGELPAACAAIAPPIAPREGVTAGLPDPESISLPCPLLVVCGANDHLVSHSDCRGWVERLSSPASLVVMPGANHFFWNKYDDLALEIGRFLDTQSRAQGRPARKE